MVSLLLTSRSDIPYLWRYYAGIASLRYIKLLREFSGPKNFYRRRTVRRRYLRRGRFLGSYSLGCSRRQCFG